MDIASLALAFVVGLAAGVAYFAALWLTLRWFTRKSPSPAWLLAGAAIRLALLMGVLFWTTDGQIERLVAALAGFFLVRFVALRRMRSDGPTPKALANGTIAGGK
jgi:F1F0 ATPase subunit 2